jgi:hypothetical protein
VLVSRKRPPSISAIVTALAPLFLNGEAVPITAGLAVRIETDDTVMLSTSDGDADMARVDGIVLDASIAAGATGRIVVVRGSRITGLAGFVVPGWVYLGLAGVLSTDLPALPTQSWRTRVGRPISASSFLFNPSDPVDLNP